MRWRLEGSGWELAPSLVQLATQVDAEWPAKHGSDGTLGNVAHSNRTSDHNPDDRDIVHAIDIGEVTEDDGIALAEALRLSRDERIKYVIHENRMFSSYDPGSKGEAWEWREYNGVNGHWSHVHVSGLTFNDLDRSVWDIGLGLGEELITRHDTADEGNPDLKANYDAMVKAGVFSSATQPGGVTFNDEFGTFLIRFEKYIVAKYTLDKPVAEPTLKPHGHVLNIQGSVGRVNNVGGV